ncbi:MAG TPA: multiheme c-type cytochrome [Gemmataceae bacterium]|nr:multiheme c-type cytochrome [Gemmataceae bacterium]
MRVAICVILSSLAIVAGRTAPVQPLASSERPYGQGSTEFAQLSSASCAAASCHGNGRVGTTGGEHSTWAAEVFPQGAHDPHARAYRVLFNAESQRMAAELKIPAAHESVLCLKCHAVEGVKPAGAAETANAAEASRTVAEGVGCGACHGPAEKWLSAHHQPGWKLLSNRDKWELYGFVPNENLVAREMNCAKCHVGAADREVNHDLIAAGHPRLAFEYAKNHFHPKYRRHWQESQPQPDFEVKAWMIGRAVNLRAAAELLRARAERAAVDDPKTPWPEFAHSSCYACHQTIEASPRRSAASSPRSPGSLLWEPWHGGGIEVAARHTPSAFTGVASPELRAVRELQEAMTKRVPNPVRVRSLADAAIGELDGWLAAVQAAEDRGASRLPVGMPRQLIRDLAVDSLSGDKLRDQDWDFLASRYLGCAAMYHASGGRAALPELTAPLTALGDALRFPRGVNNPAGFGREKLDIVRDQFRLMR